MKMTLEFSSIEEMQQFLFAKEVKNMGEGEVDSTGTDEARDPDGDGGRPQESEPGARTPEPGTSPLPDDHEEVVKHEDALAEQEQENDDE